MTAIAGAAATPLTGYEATTKSVTGRVLATLADGTEVKALGLVAGHPTGGDVGFASLEDAIGMVQRTIWDMPISPTNAANGVAILQLESGRHVAAPLSDSLLGVFQLADGGGTVHQAVEAAPQRAADVRALLTGTGALLSPDDARLSEQLVRRLPVKVAFPVDKPTFNGVEDAARLSTGLLDGVPVGRIALISGAALGAAAIGGLAWDHYRDRTDASGARTPSLVDRAVETARGTVDRWSS